MPPAAVLASPFRSSDALPPASHCWPRRTGTASCRSRAGALPGRGEDLFALRVRGDSMIDAHICDGDLVLVRKQDSAQLNDIVVAMVEAEAGGEATVKRYQRDGERVVLKPEHPTMAADRRRSARAPGADPRQGRGAAARFLRPVAKSSGGLR